MRRKDQAVQQAQTAATDASGKADAAQAQASQQQQTVTELKGDVTDLKTGMTSTVLTLQETQKNSESPLALHYKGITITPGGFLAAEFVRRSRALAADVNTPFNNLTMPGASQNTMSEFFGSGRSSRITMLPEGRLNSAKLSGYVEADFLSAAVTSNNNQSNSYSLRQLGGRLSTRSLTSDCTQWPEMGSAVTAPVAFLMPPFTQMAPSI